MGTLDVRSQKEELLSAETVENILLFRVGKARCGIHVAAVEKAIPIAEIAALPEAPPSILGVINLHGAVVAVLDLQSRMGGRAAPPGIDARLLVVGTPQRKLALLADEVSDIVAIPSAAIAAGQALVAGAALLSGIAAVPDGLVLVQDAEALLREDEEIRLADALRKTEAGR